MVELNLNFDLKFYDLYSRKGLIKLDKIFIEFLSNNYTSVHNQIVASRKFKPPKLEYSKFIIEVAPLLEEFIGKLFNIQKQVEDLKLEHLKYDNLYLCKRLFVQRRALKAYKEIEVEEFDILDIENKIKKIIGEIDDLSFANYVMQRTDHDDLEIFIKYAAWACYSKKGKEIYHDSVIFNFPKKFDSENLIPFETEIIDGLTVIKLNRTKPRIGFDLTDHGASLKKALDHANYCIYCHNQNKDSCSIGLKDKEGNYKVNDQNNILNGCPLEQKISEMNNLKSLGFSIGSLATIIIDNPMLAATGHRICNDCMKSCIYQKQDPVNIPKVETRILKDVLSLPWGFEIYSLLTRWNPLNLDRTLTREITNNKILVAGLGPAGFTLAHHLLNDGHIVVGIDAIKIEPVNPELSGIDPSGKRVDFLPIYDVESIYENLSIRTQAGFGGVSEYGITVRWNKNFLKIIRLLLERRENFSMVGGIRFNSQITTQRAFDLGFDHIALALGAGAPNLLNIPNSMERGVRTASDFLMSLQLTGAGKSNSIANLQIRLPVIIIGGGLTATDAATEALAYYPIQVEKFLARYEDNINKYGLEKTTKDWNSEDFIIADEFITHAKLFREEMKKPYPNYLDIINKYGGVKIAYRGNFKDSPSYRNNAEELKLALSEGVKFLQNIIPKSIELDEFAQVSGIVTQDDHFVSAKTILIAAGTKPNTILAKEDAINYKLDGNYFQAVDIEGNYVRPEKFVKPAESHILTSKYQDKYISFIGDLHPSYHGNVVKAMKSAKDAYPIISKLLLKNKSNANNKFLPRINKLVRSTIYKVEKLADNIVEIQIKSPLSALEFKPGQFYRLQNFEYFSKNNNKIIFSTEPLALTGAIAYKRRGIISLIVLLMGGSSNLCANLKIGEPVSLMGPTGEATNITSNQTVLLAGGGLGNAVLFSIGKAFREAGSKVIYFAGYKKLTDIYKIKEIEKAADIVVWCCDEGIIKANREQDRSFHGNIVDAIEDYAKDNSNFIKIQDIDKIIAIGSDRMMNAINEARKSKLKYYLKDTHSAIASINSPMQCMMKEICGQCIQKHTDKDTGLVTYIYSCKSQDQDMDKVDFNHLTQRLKQNHLQEINTSLWISDII